MEIRGLLLLERVGKLVLPKGIEIKIKAALVLTYTLQLGAQHAPKACTQNTRRGKRSEASA